MLDLKLFNLPAGRQVKKIFPVWGVLFCLVVQLLLVSVVQAEVITKCVDQDGKPSNVPSGGCPPGSEQRTILQNPLGGSPDAPKGVTDINDIMGSILKAVVGIMGGIVLLMFVWGAAGWLLSAGNPEKVKSGTQTMLWAAIGTVVVLISYISVSVLLSVLGTPTK
ncbi:MAG: pilin [bacterium]|nr:pilin [bacterium]